jgi:hypothetical protein
MSNSFEINAIIEEKPPLLMNRTAIPRIFFSLLFLFTQFTINKLCLKKCLEATDYPETIKN